MAIQDTTANFLALYPNLLGLNFMTDKNSKQLHHKQSCAQLYIYSNYINQYHSHIVHVTCIPTSTIEIATIYNENLDNESIL